MMQLRHALMTIAALSWLAACHTPLTGVQETFGLAKNHSTEAMLSGHQAETGPQGMPGSTAQGVADNYHYNQDSEVQAELETDYGLVELK